VAEKFERLRPGATPRVSHRPLQRRRHRFGDNAKCWRPNRRGGNKRGCNVNPNALSAHDGLLLEQLPASQARTLSQIKRRRHEHCYRL